MDGLAPRPSSSRSLRAGGTALTLLSSSLNLEALRCLAVGPQQLQELMRTLGFPPRSTARVYLRALAEMGTVERLSRSEFPSSVDYKITEAGVALLRVGDVAQRWLNQSPSGPHELGSTAAKSAIKALVEGWGSNIVRALATRPLSLTQLDGLIPRISYPSLERRLTAMRQVDLLETRRVPGRTSPYEVTRWLREAVAPTIAAASWEGRYAPNRSQALRRNDVEAAFLLAIPVIEPGVGMSGRCRLAVEVNDGTGPVFAGVLVTLERGAVTSCVANIEGDSEAWASGTPLAWARRLGVRQEGKLEVGGETALAEATVDALARAVTGPH